MPKQNRPLVRDGRLQVNKKKRTDRTYLRPGGPSTDDATPPEDAAPLDEESLVEVDEAVAMRALPVEPATPAAAAPGRVAAPAPARASAAPPAAMRAIQQQGVRKRGDIDLHALAVADTRYALHEMRRIAVLTALVIATLIVLAIVMR